MQAVLTNGKCYVFDEPADLRDFALRLLSERYYSGCYSGTNGEAEQIRAIMSDKASRCALLFLRDHDEGGKFCLHDVTDLLDKSSRRSEEIS